MAEDDKAKDAKRMPSLPRSEKHTNVDEWIGHNKPPMSPEQKVQALRDIYSRKYMERLGHTVSTHARHNLEGALIDMERTGKADDVSLGTVRRVVDQLARMERLLYEDAEVDG